MKIYAVGGAIRDKLLGLDVKDMDYVVVGSTPEELLSRGFRPVGKDFPVFLHPKTRHEYALARTERKSAPGYHGFTFHASPDVTLEEDLRRRDLTINAMAEDENGNIIDLFGGQDDLRNGILRHVSPAFAEDPVRILRVARFTARFPDFVVEKATMELMRQMVKAGEADALVSERVWQEISRGLMEICPSRMFETLRECGALERLIPELNALWGVAQSELHHPEIDAGIHVMMALDYSAEQNFSLPVRFSVLFHDLGKAVTPPEILPKHSGHEARGVPLVENICARLRIPHDCRDLAIITAREHGNILKSAELSPEKTLDLLQRCDALRRPERFAELLQASECDFRGRGKDKAQFRTAHFPQKAFWENALSAAQSVPAGKIAMENKDFPQNIPNAIREERIIAISRSFVSSSMKSEA